MIDAGRLLADLKRLRADLEDDLRVRCGEHPDLDAPLRDEHGAAHAAGRTAQPYAVWRAARHHPGCLPAIRCGFNETAAY